MKVIRKTVSGPMNLLNQTDTLYFDIETTGLSSRTSQLYLIGTVYTDGTSWHLTQWFAESFTEEISLLDAFFRQLSSFQKLAHFNGNGFDIPFLIDCAAQYHYPASFDRVESIDLFSRARKLKKIWNLSSYSQKSVENFLGLAREDLKSGGELISEYLTYISEGGDDLLHELLLHNSDDVSNLPALADAIAQYENLDQAVYAYESSLYEDAVTLQLTLRDRILRSPVSFSISKKGMESTYEIRMEKDRIQILLPIFHAELKKFYSDYKNYDYLPKEDYAISRKLSAFLDSSKKVKATAKTCYTRHAGDFIPVPEAILGNDFLTEYKGKTHYLLLGPEGFRKQEEAELLISSILKLLY